MEPAIVAARALLLVSLCAVAVVFVVYPALTWVAALLRGRRAGTQPRDLPSVTIVTIVRNGEGLVREKLQNSLSVAYPAGRREVILYSDGSTDGTDAIAREFEASGVRLLGSKEHAGKIAGLNAAVQAATGEVVVFTDADALLAPDALEALVARLADPSIGGVCGLRVLGRGAAGLAEAQSDYVRFDSWIKRAEARLGRMTSNDGKLFAVRRSLFRPLPPAVTDDLYTALDVIEQGAGFVFEPRARAIIRTPSRDARHEVSRRRRIVCRSLRGIWLKRRLLNPLSFGWFSVGLFVNKVIRRLLPLALIGLLVASIPLASQGRAYQVFLGLQVAGYVAALAGAVSSRGAPGSRISAKALYVCAGMLGTLLGLLDFLRGRQIDRWDPLKSEPPPRSGPPRVAYVVSRFPKLTETFVLREALGILEQGIELDVFPLLRGREAVRHVEVDRLMPRVRYLALVSPGVVAANVAMLVMRPLRYLRTLVEALFGTVGCVRFFLGVLVFFPKAVRIAVEVERLGACHIHAHFAHHPALVAWIVRRLAGIPFSFTAHGSDLHVNQTMLGRKLADCAFAVTVSEYNRSFMLDRTGPEHAPKIRVVRCGVDPSRFAPPEDRPAAERLLVVCVAALRAVKGHRHLVEACRIARGRGVDLVCELIGDGELREEIERQVQEAGLGDHLRLRGALPHDLVLAALRSADVFALASVTDERGRREGIPVALMEAMACGLPVIASRQSGIPELVLDGETGLLAPPGDADALAAALERLARDPDLRRRLGRAGREKVMREYDEARSAREMAALFLGRPLPVDLPPSDVQERG